MIGKFKPRKLIRSQKGQSIVEFAFIVPIFLLLALGIMEFGNIFSHIHSMNQTTKLAARSASLGNTSDVLKTLTEESVSAFIPGAACGTPVDSSTTTTITCSSSSQTINVTFTPVLSARKMGEDISVKASMDYAHLTGYFTFALPLKRTNITKVEYMPPTP